MPPKASTSSSPVAKRTSTASAAPKRLSATPPRQNISTTPKGSATPPKANVTPPRTGSTPPKAKGPPPKQGGSSIGLRGRALGSTVSAPGTAAAKKASAPAQVAKSSGQAEPSTTPRQLESVFSESDEEDVADSPAPRVVVSHVDSASSSSANTVELHPGTNLDLQTQAEARQRSEEELQRLQRENAELQKSQTQVEMQRQEIAELRAQSLEVDRDKGLVEALQACREELENVQQENATLRTKVSDLENSKKELEVEVHNAMVADQQQHYEMMRLLESSLQSLQSEKEKQAVAHDECLQNLEAQIRKSEDWWRSLVNQLRSEISAIREDTKELTGIGVPRLPKEVAEEAVTNERYTSHESLAQNSRKSVSFRDAHECFSPHVDRDDAHSRTEFEC